MAWYRLSEGARRSCWTHHQEMGKRITTIFRMAWRRIGQESVGHRAIPCSDHCSLSRQSLETAEWMELECNVKEQLNIVQQDDLLAVSLYDVLQQPWRLYGPLPLGEV